jgi:hypothetical protein
MSGICVQPGANGMEAIQKLRNHKKPVKGQKAQSNYMTRVYGKVRDKLEQAVQRIDPDNVGGCMMYTLVISGKAWRDNKHLKITSSKELVVRSAAAHL